MPSMQMSMEMEINSGSAYLQLVRDKQHRPWPRQALDGVPEEVGAHAGVHGAQGVVQQQDGPLAVQGPRQADPLPLAPAQVSSPLANLEEGRGAYILYTL